MYEVTVFSSENFQKAFCKFMEEDLRFQLSDGKFTFCHYIDFGIAKEELNRMDAGFHSCTSNYHYTF